MQIARHVSENVARHVVQWKWFVKQHASKNENNVSKNVSVLLNRTIHTQTHVNAHLDTQCDVTTRTKYRRCQEHAEFVATRVSECFYTKMHVARQIAGHVEWFVDASSALHPSVKAVLDCRYRRVIWLTVRQQTALTNSLFSSSLFSDCCTANTHNKITHG